MGQATSSGILTPIRKLAPFTRLSVLAALGALVCLISAFLIGIGYWYLTAILLTIYPAFVVLHRRPLVVLPVWLVLGPLIAVTERGAIRQLFWVVHRGLPLVALIAVLVSRLVGTRNEPFPRLGVAELMMGGYVLATLVSIIFTSLEPVAVSYLLYDRIVAPMMLYLIIRLVEPQERQLRALVPVFGFILLFETAVGLTSWWVPGVLPNEWLNNVGARTTGSLKEVNLFGTTVLFAGLFVFYGALSSRSSRQRSMAIALLGLAIFMTFMTFSRASWLAAVLVILGLIALRPKHLARILIVGIPTVALLIGTGLLDDQLEFADQRFLSERSANSALTRLPVAVAAVRMFSERPVAGWGYENFDRFDYQFAGQFGNLIYPDRDHASHNLYLTLLAEQGLIGFVLFLGPMVYWLRETIRVYPRLPTDGYVSGNLVIVSWLLILSHLVVNNFTRMQLPFGFGVWWIALGFVASTVARFRPDRLAPPSNSARASGHSAV